ncbi:MAG TPA: amidohydrolase family protein [Opitutaceae bacterium]|nr:amidohydrolase family protein [Opitutaceae bacterium]HRJ47874.1 amidohydrolase family protein [Opitutaceae bacterium]
MQLIDAHVHLYPPEVNRDPADWAAACGERHWAELCTRRRKNGQRVQAFPSVTELLHAMDAAGVGRAVLLGWYWERPETCRMQNRFYAECVRAHPDRLSAFATLHPGAGLTDTLENLGQARDAGFCGLGELSPHSQGYACDDPVLDAALEWAGKMGWPVNLHVTDPESRAYPGRVETPLADFLKLARRFPQTTFILAHWGGLLPLRTAEAMPDNVYYDTAASPLLYGQDIWRKFCAQVPAERVLFGSDFPLNLYPGIDAEPNLSRLVAEVHRSELDAAALRAIVADNAKRLLRL